MEIINRKCPHADKYIGVEGLYGKICIKCNKPKKLDSFYVCSGYYSSTCKVCAKERARAWKQKNSEKVREYKRNNYKKDPSKVLDQQKNWRKNATEEQKKHIRDYMREYGKKYYLENKLRIASLRLARERKNSKDPIKKLHRNMSRSIRWHLQKNNKHTFSLLGYTVQELKKHLESQFSGDMSWSNYGLHGWHIDHIMPISSFDMQGIDDENFKKCWALNNLQPLWAEDNRRKYNKLPLEFRLPAKPMVR